LFSCGAGALARVLLILRFVVRLSSSSLVRRNFRPSGLVFQNRIQSL
jgi:hypothetical protein